VDAETSVNSDAACCQSHPVEMFIKTTHEVFGCLQLWVFNPKLGLSTAVKCDSVFIVCVNDPLSIHIPDN
jgi:hypothetical protein